MKTYYAYMLKCADGSFYVGITNNLEQRVGQHQSGEDRGCYTFGRGPVLLVYSSDFRNVDDAIAWEKQLKGWSRAKKLALIENNWANMSELARNHWGSALSPFDRLRVTKPRFDGLRVTKPCFDRLRVTRRV